MTRVPRIPVEPSNFACCLQGLRTALPLYIGTAPFGVLFGVLGVSSGLSPMTVMASSLMVFAGSSQFVAAKLVADGAGLALIIATTFVVNLRHALYGASLGPYLQGLPQRWIASLAFLLTDEAYAIAVRNYHEHGANSGSRFFHLGAGLGMFLNWQLWTAIGLGAGSQLANIPGLGLEFAMVVTFIGIVVPMVSSRPKLVAAIVAGSAALLFDGVPGKIGLLLAAFAGIASGWLAERLGRTDEPP